MELTKDAFGSEAPEDPSLAWDKIASGYDQYVTDTETWLANEALDRIGLRAGQRFLDVAAGCGGLSLPAARRGAHVLAVDWSREMISLFNARVKSENLSNAQGLVMDGHDLKIEDNFYDISGSQFGVMLFPDLAQALSEMVRVTKPGGKVLLIAYGAPEHVEFLGFFIEALQTVRPHFQGLPSDPPPLEFQVADPKVLFRKLSTAGLREVRVDTVVEELAFSSGQQFWNWIMHGNPIVGQVLSALDLTKDQVDAVRLHLDQKIRERTGGGEAAILTNPVNIGFGTK